MPKVSVVLVNYNHAIYLDERISSLLAQTYEDFELLIIDNGSSDHSLEVIRKYESDPRIRIQAYSQNASPYERWNESMNLIKGKYLMMVCADDSCHPQILERLAKQLDDFPAMDMAYSQSLEINSEGKPVRSCKYWTDELDDQRWSNDFIDSGINECQYLYIKCTIINVGAILMRRSAFIKAGGFDRQMLYSSDWMLYAKILANSQPVAFIAEPLNYCRKNTSTFIPDEGDFLEARVQILRYMFQAVPPPEAFFNKIYEPTIGWWLRLAESGKISLIKNWRIYRIMKDIEPSLNYRIIKYIFEAFGRKIGQVSHN